MHIYISPDQKELTHRGQDKMAAILQTFQMYVHDKKSLYFIANFILICVWVQFSIGSDSGLASRRQQVLIT